MTHFPRPLSSRRPFLLRPFPVRLPTVHSLLKSLQIPSSLPCPTPFMTRILSRLHSPAMWRLLVVVVVEKSHPIHLVNHLPNPSPPKRQPKGLLFLLLLPTRLTFL